MTAEVVPRLAELELVIERGMATFVEVGAALLTIRDGRLYRETHRTFEEYCRERWGWTRQRASQVIAASAVSTVVDIQTERQARELAPLRDEPELLADAWEEAKTSTNGKPTAEAVAVAVKRRVTSGDDRARIVALHAGGKSQMEISDETGFSQTTVSKVLRAAADTDAGERLPRRRQPATPQTLALGKVQRAVRDWSRLADDEDYIPAPELARRLRVLDQALTFLTQKRAQYHDLSRREAE